MIRQSTISYLLNMIGSTHIKLATQHDPHTTTTIFLCFFWVLSWLKQCHIVLILNELALYVRHIMFSFFIELLGCL